MERDFLSSGMPKMKIKRISQIHKLAFGKIQLRKLAENAILHEAQMRFCEIAGYRKLFPITARRLLELGQRVLVIGLVDGIQESKLLEINREIIGEE
ncbi:MAG: hypothetical protein ACHQNE_00830, partial [Candidatus Kapaibacterium sp.]